MSRNIFESFYYYSLSLILYPLSLIPYPLYLIPTLCCLSPSAVPVKKFRWGLFLSLLLLLLFLLSQVKVKSTLDPRPKTGDRQNLGAATNTCHHSTNIWLSKQSLGDSRNTMLLLLLFRILSCKLWVTFYSWYSGVGIWGYQSENLVPTYWCLKVIWFNENHSWLSWLGWVSVSKSTK